jgi:hypothetical protein
MLRNFVRYVVDIFLIAFSGQIVVACTSPMGMYMVMPPNLLRDPAKDPASNPPAEGEPTT